MSATLVVTVLGPDRAGIVQDLARVIADAGGNWEESSLARMAGRFAGMVKVSVPSVAAADSVTSGLRALPGLQIVVDRGGGDEAQGAPVRLEITGTDRPGIVRDVTRVLVQRGANIVAFSTDYVEAPMAGGLLFHAEVEARVPPEAMDALRAGLEELQDDLQLDVRQ
jgi:glycine cleavage system regulatory protein